MNEEQLIILEAQEARAWAALEYARATDAPEQSLRALLLAWGAAFGAASKERQRIESET